MSKATDTVTTGGAFLGVRAVARFLMVLGVAWTAAWATACINDSGELTLDREDRFVSQAEPDDLPGPIRPGVQGGPPGGGMMNAPSVDVGIQPPAELELDGQQIQEGEFVLTEVTAHAFPNGTGPVVTRVLAPSDPPMVHQAIIGSPLSMSLVEVPVDTVVLVVVGFFDAIRPDLPPAPFSLTIFGAFSQDQDFTIFLPFDTGELVYQWTGCGTSAALTDNQDVFCEARNIAPSEYASIRTDPDEPGVVLFPSCAAPSQTMQEHGTVQTRGVGVPSSCGASTTAMGSDQPETRTIQLGQSSGTFDFTYETFSQEDQITVTYEGATLFDTGCVGANGTVPLSFSGTATTVTVSVQPNCADPGATGTQWEFTVGCPR